jgi:hypothetical protein
MMSAYLSIYLSMPIRYFDQIHFLCYLWFFKLVSISPPLCSSVSFFIFTVVQGYIVTFAKFL